MGSSFSIQSESHPQDLGPCEPRPGRSSSSQGSRSLSCSSRDGRSQGPSRWRATNSGTCKTSSSSGFRCSTRSFRRWGDCWAEWLGTLIGDSSCSTWPVAPLRSRASGGACVLWSRRRSPSPRRSYWASVRCSGAMVRWRAVTPRSCWWGTPAPGNRRPRTLASARPGIPTPLRRSWPVGTGYRTDIGMLWLPILLVILWQHRWRRAILAGACSRS